MSCSNCYLVGRLVDAVDTYLHMLAVVHMLQDESISVCVCVCVAGCLFDDVVHYMLLHVMHQPGHAPNLLHAGKQHVNQLHSVKKKQVSVELCPPQRTFCSALQV